MSTPTLVLASRPRTPVPTMTPTTTATGPDLARSGRAWPAWRVLADLDPPVWDGPQAQGDVAVLPWPDFMSPHQRHAHVTATVRLPRRGLCLLGTHTVLSETGARSRWAPWPTEGLPTLGTLVVPAGAVCRIAHDTHADLRVGPGVYAVRRQRRGSRARTELVFD